MISLVNSDLIKKYEYCGSTFLYKEALPRDVERLYQKYQGTAKTEYQLDFCGVREEVLTTYVVGWENVIDSAGTQIQFDSQLVSALPTEVRNHLHLLITTGSLPEMVND